MEFDSVNSILNYGITQHNLNGVSVRISEFLSEKPDNSYLKNVHIYSNTPKKLLAMQNCLFQYLDLLSKAL